MEQKKTSLLFKIIKGALWFFYPKIKTQGTEHIPQEPAIYVGNHTQMHGPIACELHFPVPRYTWCAAEMIHLKEVPGYAFEDFWSQKPKHTHWYFKICSYLIAPLSVVVFGNANTIAVRRDARVMTTMRESMQKLQEGWSMVIFPEQDKKYNHILYDFQEGYIDLARLYFRKTGQALRFVPFYNAPKLRTMTFGEGITFNPDAPADEEKKRINTYLMEEITRIAEAQPLHTVVPYRNIPKKDYPKNRRGDAK